MPGNIQYAGQLPTGVGHSDAPNNVKTEMNPAVLVQNTTTGPVQVADTQFVVTSACDTAANNQRLRNRAGRGRSKSTGRGRRSVSGPGPEVDHNIEVGLLPKRNKRGFPRFPVEILM